MYTIVLFRDSLKILRIYYQKRKQRVVVAPTSQQQNKNFKIIPINIFIPRSQILSEYRMRTPQTKNRILPARQKRPVNQQQQVRPRTRTTTEMPRSVNYQ